MTTLGSGFVDRARVRLGVQEVYSPADTSDPCTFPHPSCSVSSPSPPPADSTTPARGASCSREWSVSPRPCTPWLIRFLGKSYHLEVDK